MGDFDQLGVKRTSNQRAFIERMEKLEPRPGPTYQFAFWGIAQFMDSIKWSITGIMPGMNINFNNFCKSPPVHCVLYTLKKNSLRDDDKRHLESRKNYYFRSAFWSSEKPIAIKKLKKFFPEVNSKKFENITKKKATGMWACCTERS